MGAAEVVAVLRANTTEFMAKMGEAEAAMGRVSRAGGSNFEKAGKVANAALLGIAGAAVGAGVAAVDLGEKYDSAHVQLENAFKNAGTSADEYKGQISTVDQQMSRYGYTNTQTEGALARLTTVTGNAKGSIGEMGLAANIAKNRHIDLNSATDLLAKTMGGNVTAAKRMGVTIPEEILKIKDPVQKAHDITKLLEDRFKGSAASAAGTMGGKLDAMKASAENLGANIGQKLIPILEQVVDRISKVTEYITSHKSVMISIGIALGVIFAGLLVWWVVNTIAAMTFWTAATGGIIILVAAIAVGIAWIVSHWGEVWGECHRIIMGVWNWIKDHWQLLVEIITGPIGIVVVFIVSHFNQIKDIVMTVVDTVVNFFGSIPGKIIGFFTGIWDKVWTAFKAVATWLYTNVELPVINFFKAIPGKITALFTGIWDTVWTVFKTVAVWLYTNVELPAINFFKAIPGKIAALFVGIWDTVWTDFKTVAVWLYTNVELPVINWFKAIPGKAATAVGDIVGTAFVGLTTIGNWLETNVWEPIKNFFTGLPGRIASAAGDLLGGIGGAAGKVLSAVGFADGGQPPVGVPSIVGERGPELFVPHSAGTIIPNHALSGGGGSDQPIQITVQIAGSDVAQVLLPSLLRLKRTGGYGSLGLS